MYRQLALTWTQMWKTNSEELKSRAIGWRKELSIHRTNKPSRLDRARRLGYKAKQGIVVIRSRVRRGGMRKQRPVAGRRSKHFFFSSRRRHTRSLCDWSSDVCSSD